MRLLLSSWPHTGQTLARDVVVLALGDYPFWGPTVSSRAGTMSLSPSSTLLKGSWPPDNHSAARSSTLPVCEAGFNPSPACYKCSIWHHSFNVLRFPPTCRVLLPAKPDPLQAERPKLSCRLAAASAPHSISAMGKSMPVVGRLLPTGHLAECKPNAHLGTHAHV